MSRKLIFISMGIVLAISLPFGIFACWIHQPSALPMSEGDLGGCSRYGIQFDDTAVQRQFTETADVLKDPAIIWVEDRAHRLVATSPRITPDSLPPHNWMQAMQALERLPSEARIEQVPYQAALEIMDYSDTFCDRGVPGIVSMLPEDTELGTTIYLVAFTNPSAMTVDSRLVMNTDLELYFGKSAGFLNTLGHELFHIGYWRFQPYQEEVWPDSYSLKAALVTLQNEGMATYSQEISMNLYPMRLEQDLFWSQRKLLVRVLTGRVNRLIEDASTLPEEQVISILYKGINQRALYAVGAHMARTIDQELGREALAETVGGGPRTFIETYNQLVNDPWRITELPAPPTLNPTQALRRAARQADVERIPKLIAQIAELPAESLNGAAFEEILSAGLILRERGQVDLAVQVFESLVSCFPDHPQSHIRLGHAYLSAGKQALAKGCYDRALDIDPSLAILIE